MNVYAVINAELTRLHQQMRQSLDDNCAENANVFKNQICDIQKALLQALEEQPSHDEAIADLQNSVAEILLTGGKGD